MKKIILFVLLFVSATRILSQQTDTKHPITKQDYLAKSKNQKTGAWVLLGGGAALIATGFLIGDRKESSFDDAGTGAVFGVLGFLSAVGSIPLFIASGRNKRKAMNVSTYLEIQQNPVARRTGLICRSSPALSIKINF
jgi:hypothetical protein